jgi:hypothetical protein
MRRIDLLAVARSHSPFLFFAVIAAALLFTNLGSDYLWAYVFGVDHARWSFGAFTGVSIFLIPWSEVAGHLAAEGGQISEVAEIKETGWENRENIHSHGFWGDVLPVSTGD